MRRRAGHLASEWSGTGNGVITYRGGVIGKGRTRLGRKNAGSTRSCRKMTDTCTNINSATAYIHPVRDEPILALVTGSATASCGRTARLHIEDVLGTSEEVCGSVMVRMRFGSIVSSEHLQHAKNSRPSVVPTRYSTDSPLVRERRAERYICIIHMLENSEPMKNSGSERAMTIRNTTISESDSRVPAGNMIRIHEQTLSECCTYRVGLQDQSGCESTGTAGTTVERGGLASLGRREAGQEVQLGHSPHPRLVHLWPLSAVAESAVAAAVLERVGE